MGMAEEIKSTLEYNPPFNAQVQFDIKDAQSGWHYDTMPKELVNKLQSASTTYFGNDTAFIGEGAFIPLLNILQKHYPNAEYITTGVLGPGSNAHGPNECLDIHAAIKLSNCLSMIIAEY